MESRTDNWARPFMRSLLSEADGTGSSARFCMVLVVLFTLGWVTGLVVHEHRLPDLGAVGEYTVLVCGALYASIAEQRCGIARFRRTMVSEGGKDGIWRGLSNRRITDWHRNDTLDRDQRTRDEAGEGGREQVPAAGADTASREVVRRRHSYYEDNAERGRPTGLPLFLSLISRSLKRRLGVEFSRFLLGRLMRGTDRARC